jgi:hypothetical protein
VGVNGVAPATAQKLGLTLEQAQQALANFRDAAGLGDHPSLPVIIADTGDIIAPGGSAYFGKLRDFVSAETTPLTGTGTSTISPASGYGAQGPESGTATIGSNIALDSNGNQLLLTQGNPPLVSSNTSTQTPSVIYVTPKGVGVSSDVLSLQETSPNVGDFTGLNGASVEEIISRVPSSWTNAPQRMGQGLVWFDDTGNEAIRIHGPGVNAPFGSNSASGWVLRIHAPNGQYYVEFGNIVSRQSNDGHIPMLGDPNATK